MANEVFYFSSSDAGAPVLNNAAGALLGVLQACLVDGFGSKSVTSIVVASNVATVTCSAHGFLPTVGKLVLIAGATPAGLNGLKQLTGTTTNTFTFAAPGISDQTATGTITAKRGGIGWTRQFTGTNKAVYKSSDVTATGMLLRIDDTAAAPASAYEARAVMYESMSDIDTGVAPSPTVAMFASGLWWGKGSNTTTAKTWTLIGNGKLFYLSNQSSNESASTASMLFVFGDIISYRASDPYRGILTGSVGTSDNGDVYASSMFGFMGLGGTTPNGGAYLTRLSNGMPGAVKTGIGGVCIGASGYRIPGYNNSYPLYPSPVDNGLVIAKPVLVVEENAAMLHPFRGEMPGMALPLASQPATAYDILTDIIGTTNPYIFMPIRVYDPSVGVMYGKFMLDLVGPWGN